MDLGFHRAGYEIRWVCEMDPFRRRLLAKHFPDAKQYPDLTTLDPTELEPVDVLIGGTPCQDLSQAGQRAGLDGARSGLFWDYMRIRNELNVPWCVWENVEGAFSSNHGLDFACVLGAMVGADVTVPAGGWARAGVVTGPWGGACWRMVDAQYFGVPQRRRRVFVVGHLGGECPPEILFEPARSDGHFAEGRKARPHSAGSVADGARSARTLTRGLGRLDGESEDFVVAHTLRGEGFDGSEDGTGRGTPIVEVAERESGSVGALDTMRGGPDDNSAQAGHLTVDSPATRVGSTVRRLTPTECERLMGWPDHWTVVDDTDEPNPRPDGPRYAACGDGVVAPVAEWIGRRLLPFIEAARGRS